MRVFSPVHQESLFCNDEADVAVGLPLLPAVIPSQSSSRTVAFAVTSRRGTRPLNDLGWHRSDWLLSPQQCSNNGPPPTLPPVHTLSVCSP